MTVTCDIMLTLTLSSKIENKTKKTNNKKETKIKLSLSFAILTAGKPVKPRTITVGSNNLSSIVKATFYLFYSFILIL